MFAAWFVSEPVFDERERRQSTKRAKERSVARIPVWIEEGR